MYRQIHFGKLCYEMWTMKYSQNTSHFYLTTSHICINVDIYFFTYKWNDSAVWWYLWHQTGSVLPHGQGDSCPVNCRTACFSCFGILCHRFFMTQFSLFSTRRGSTFWILSLCHPTPSHGVSKTISWHLLLYLVREAVLYLFYNVFYEI